MDDVIIDNAKVDTTTVDYTKEDDEDLELREDPEVVQHYVQTNISDITPASSVVLDTIPEERFWVPTVITTTADNEVSEHVDTVDSKMCEPQMTSSTTSEFVVSPSQLEVIDENEVLQSSTSFYLGDVVDPAELADICALNTEDNVGGGTGSVTEPLLTTAMNRSMGASSAIPSIQRLESYEGSVSIRSGTSVTTNDRYYNNRPNFMFGPSGSHGCNLSEPVLPWPASSLQSDQSQLKRMFKTTFRRMFGSRGANIDPCDSTVSVDMTGLKDVSSVLPGSNSMSKVPHWLQHGTRGHTRESNTGSRSGSVSVSSNRERQPRIPLFLRNPTQMYKGTRGASSLTLRPDIDDVKRLPHPCDQCPRCRKVFFAAMEGAANQFDGPRPCTCRVCQIIDSNWVATIRRNNSGLGAFCQACYASGYLNTGGAAPSLCARYSLTNSHESVVNHSKPVEVGVTDLNISPMLCQSQTSLSDPLCRICHFTAEKEEPLISPCRCTGSLQFVHMACLIHWLQVSAKKHRKPPQCELCSYRYQRHKVFHTKNLEFPAVSIRDRILHILFIFCSLLMVVCSVITIICFKSDKISTDQIPSQKDRAELSGQEIVTLVCGVLFFCGFFVAMYVEVKANATLFKVVKRFWALNYQWIIDQYNPLKDQAYQRQLKATVSKFKK